MRKDHHQTPSRHVGTGTQANACGEDMSESCPNCGHGCMMGWMDDCDIYKIKKGGQVIHSSTPKTPKTLGEVIAAGFRHFWLWHVTQRRWYYAGLCADDENAVWCPMCEKWHDVKERFDLPAVGITYPKTKAPS